MMRSPGSTYRIRRPRRWMALATLIVALALAPGCSDAPSWRTKPLDDAFPELTFNLTGEGGDTITEARVKGSVTLLFFGYTFCPDVCPTTLARLSAAIAQLPEADRGRVNVLFVSVDPARDDPARLAAYTDAFGPRVIGATAERDRLERLTSRYGSSFQYGPKDDRGNYLVSHGSSVLVFDADGDARLLIRPSHDTDAIAHDLRQLVAS